jgi:ABC-2 type transport system ATP-binding protein
VKTSARPQVVESTSRPKLRAVSTAVVLRDLRREYDGREVVRGVSLEIQEGEIFGLLGPNGAGKTTLLSMVSTRLRPTSGDVWVHGKHVVHDVDAARRLLNVAPQEEALYPSLTGAENLAFFAELYGVRGAALRHAVAEALEAVGLTARKDDRVGTYSGGMRRRLNLGCALVSGPRVVLLDEPTVAGRSAVARAHLRRRPRASRSRHDHPLHDASPSGSRRPLRSHRDRRRGARRRRAARSPSCSRSLAPPRSSSCRLLQPLETTAPIEAIEGVRTVEAVGHELRIFTTRAQQVLSRVYRAVATLGHAVVRTRVTPVTLDDVFLELTGKGLRD